MKIAYIPRVKEGKSKYCMACKRCEMCCPVWAIYVLFDEENVAEKAKT